MAVKYTSSIVTLMSIVALAGCDRQKEKPHVEKAPEASAPATSAPAAGLGSAIADGSPHFSRVMARLDVGGKMLEFGDHEGRRDMFIGLGKTLLENVPELKAQGPIDVAGLIDACGLAQTAASGKSLRKDGDAWLLRGYNYLPGKKPGFSSLMGAAPEKLRGPGMLPDTADLVIESQLDATTMPVMLEKIATACGHEKDLQKALGESLPIGGTLRDVLAKTKLHLILGLDFADWKSPANPLPCDFFLQIEGAKDLMAGIVPQLENGLGQAREFGTRRGWELPTPPPALHPKALLLFDTLGTVTLVSRQQYLEQVDSTAKKLAANTDFKGATDHFPETANLLVYASPRTSTVVAWAIRNVAAKGVVEVTAAPMLIKASEYLVPRPWSLCVACEADGIATTSELPFPADPDMATGALPLLSATSVMFIGARAWKKGSDRAGCIMNIRNVQQAVRSYQNLHELKEGDPIPWDEIFGSDKFMNKPTCPEGGTYTIQATIPKVGTLAYECNHPDHNPQQHEDW